MKNVIGAAIDDMRVKIPCPHCLQKIEKKIGRLKTNNEFACPGCGGSIVVDTAELVRDVAKADKLLGNAFRR